MPDDLLTDWWYPGDWGVDRATGKVIGAYAGPTTVRLHVRDFISDVTFIKIQSGVAKGIVTVDPRRIRHLRAGDLGA